MIFSSGQVVGLRGVDLIAEVAEVVGLVVAGYLGGPFVVSFVPVDAFVFRAFVPAGAEVPAVLGESADPQVFFPVIQPVMVDMVHDKMVRSVHYLPVHFDANAAGFSHSVKIPVRSLREPGIFTQRLVVFGIDDSEQAASQRYNTRLFIPRIGKARWVEIFAFLLERADAPSTYGACFLPAD